MKKLSLDLELSESVNGISHPLDGVEKICLHQDYTHDRCSVDQLNIKVDGDHGPYIISFSWDEMMGGIQITCKTGWVADNDDMTIIARTVLDINAQMRIGHFDVLDDNFICFRYTLMLRGVLSEESFDPINEIIDIAVSASDRFHALFAMIKGGDFESQGLLDLALSSVEGHA